MVGWNDRRDVTSLSRQQYADLLAFRSALRRYLRWSEEEAGRIGLTRMQHHVLLAVKGHPDERGPTIGDIAGYLALRPHSTAELVARVVATDHLARVTDPHDRRVVRLRLTASGERCIQLLTRSHLEELRRLAPLLDAVALEDARGEGGPTVVERPPGSGGVAR